MNQARSILVLFPDDRPEPARTLAERLDGAPARGLKPAGGSGARRIAAALVAAERAIEQARPGALVVCGGGPEIAAAVLVAVKLGVPVAWVRDVDASSGNATAGESALADLGGPVAESLADLSVHASGDPEREAAEIRA